MAANMQSRHEMICASKRDIGAPFGDVEGARDHRADADSGSSEHGGSAGARAHMEFKRRQLPVIGAARREAGDQATNVGIEARLVCNQRPSIAHASVGEGVEDPIGPTRGIETPAVERRSGIEGFSGIGAAAARHCGCVDREARQGIMGCSGIKRICGVEGVPARDQRSGVAHQARRLARKRSLQASVKGARRRIRGEAHAGDRQPLPEFPIFRSRESRIEAAELANDARPRDDADRRVRARPCKHGARVRHVGRPMPRDVNAAFCDAGVADQNDVGRAVARRALERAGVKGRREPIVGVEEMNPFGIDPGEAGVARRGWAGIGLGQDGDARIAGGACAGERERRILRAVVDDDVAPRAHGLRAQGLNRLRQRRGGIVGRRDDADLRLSRGGEGTRHWRRHPSDGK